MRNDPLARNPFHLLAVAPTASRAEIERQGQKLIGLLELGLSQAKTAATPLGVVPRHADDVRWALGELRDPERRLAHELWAALSPREVTPPAPPARLDEALAPWPGADALIAPRPGLTIDLFALLGLLGGGMGLGAEVTIEQTGASLPNWGLFLVLLTVVTPVTLWRLITRWCSPQVVHRLGMMAGHESADAPGLAALAAAQVSLGRDRGEGERAWVEETLAGSTPLRSGGVVASALLTARRGDVDGSLGLLQSVEQLRTMKGLPVAFRVARERRALAAAGRGDWAAVADIAALPGPVCTSRLTRLLGAVARRLLRRPDAPSDRRLRWLHALAPHRALTADLLRRALGVAVMDPEVPYGHAPAPSSVGPLPVEPWARALGRLAYARLGRPTLGDLDDLGAAFDEALSGPALAERIEQRAREVGAAPGRMLGQLRDEVADEIARAADAGDWPIGGLEAPGLTMERASRKLRDLLLAAIEPTSEAMKQRVLAEKSLAAVDEWREALALWQRYERLARLAGPMARRLAWPHVRADLGKLAVWLWNKRGEKTIAHAIFRWLLDEAIALDDSEAIALQRKNVDCGF